MIVAGLATSMTLHAEGIGIAVVKADGTIHEVEFDRIDRVDITPEAITIHQQSGESVSHDVAQVERINIGVKTGLSGIENVIEPGDIAVWPTKVETGLNVQGLTKPTTIAVYSLSGVLIKSIDTPADSNVTIDLSALSAGHYIVKIGEKHSVRIIKL